ncbi:MAG: GTPase Era [Rhodospirillaceae bacterium TMED8]|nr:GTPase Era [Magnetovibrio sp.]OUT51637.1 MAG: GTPase Era [Rhodospirillaceae bacterium TMED8]|tara:strand:+ start:2555 stop:3448 length:894 start_codon:yes stop_codon:yes gene_type:complete
MTKKAGFIAVVGAPNVGKSTFINRAVGTKVTIVSPKVQTTRARVLGICMRNQTQVIFIDTPGIFQPIRRLDRAMVAAAWGGAHDADLILLIVDATRGIDPNTNAIIDKLIRSNHRVILTINKIDLLRKDALLQLTGKLAEFDIFDDIFMISARTGDGLKDLLDHLSILLPECPWLFPEDQVTDMPQRLLSAEITREKLYLQLRQELPYATTVETENWEDKKDGSVKINQVIFVQRITQKAILLGKNGSQIKKLGEAARKELEIIFGCRVHLFLFVKVRKNWGDDPDRYHDWGLDFNA